MSEINWEQKSKINKRWNIFDQIIWNVSQGIVGINCFMQPKSEQPTYIYKQIERVVERMQSTRTGTAYRSAHM